MLCAVSKQSQSKSPSTPTHHVFPPLFPHLSLFLTHSSPATPCLSCLLLDQAGPCPALGRQRIQALLAMAPPSVPLSPGRSLGSGSALTPLFPLQKLQCLLLRKPAPTSQHSQHFPPLLLFLHSTDHPLTSPGIYLFAVFIDCHCPVLPPQEQRLCPVCYHYPAPRTGPSTE